MKRLKDKIRDLLWGEPVFHCPNCTAWNQYASGTPRIRCWKCNKAVLTPDAEITWRLD